MLPGCGSAGFVAVRICCPLSLGRAGAPSAVSLTMKAVEICLLLFSKLPSFYGLLRFSYLDSQWPSMRGIGAPGFLYSTSNHPLHLKLPTFESSAPKYSIFFYCVSLQNHHRSYAKFYLQKLGCKNYVKLFKIVLLLEKHELQNCLWCKIKMQVILVNTG